MRSLSLIAFWLFVSPSIASADTVRITSGEHSTFSRLVIYLERPVVWRFGRSENGYALEYDGPEIEFDTDEVFRYIPRKRIVNIETDTARKRIDIDCTCTADAFELRNGLIVLDFKDGAPDIYSRFETPLETQENSAETPERQTLVGPNAPTQPPKTVAPAPLLPAPDFTSALSHDQVELLQATLLENLSRAMSQGLVDTHTAPSEDAPVVQERPLSDREIADSLSNGAIESQPVEAPLSGVSIRTQVELDATRRTEPVQTVAANCPPPSLLDISNWGNPDEMLQGLAQRRSSLVSPAMLPSPDGALALARYYVWLGFGAEARAALALHQPADHMETASGAAIYILSGVMDDLPTATDDAWHRCQGAPQMWAFLANGPEAPPLPSAKMNIIRMFEGLPNHLKHHLGPMLFDRFIAAQDKDAAETIRRSVARSAERLSPQVEFLDAQTRLDSGDVEGALQEFSRLAKGSDIVAVRALIALAETSLENETKLPEWAMESLSAQAAVYKGTPESAPIQDLLLAHFIADDRVDEVARYLENEPFGADQGRLLAVLEAALPRADDKTFSELAVRNRRLILENQSAGSLRNYVSNRLKSLGFETTAASFQVPISTGGHDVSRNDVREVASDPQIAPPSMPQGEDSAQTNTNALLSKLSAESTLPGIETTVVSIPQSQDLLAAARTRRQLVNELLATVPEVE